MLILVSWWPPHPFRILVVMWVEASSPYAPCDWERCRDRIYRIDRADEFVVTRASLSA